MLMTNVEVTNTATVRMNGYFVFICTNDGENMDIYHLWILLWMVTQRIINNLLDSFYSLKWSWYIKGE
jgi:hypothetical protein